MKICIYGAGAVGGLMGARLAHVGHDVSMVARGAHLDAMRQNGLTLHSKGKEFHVTPACSDDPADLGLQDYVILTMKAQTLPAAAGGIASLLGPETAVLTIQNGLPWWYFQGVGGENNNRRLLSVDPQGLAWEAIPADRIIGGVIAAACSIPEPGVVHHGAAGVVRLGEPDGSDTERCRLLGAALDEAGLQGAITDRIRDALWFKLWGNVSFSAIAVLTRGTVGGLAADSGTQSVARKIMEETEAVAKALGSGFPSTIDDRVEASLAMGGHKTSILQDIEAGRPMEIDAMFGSVIETARITGISTPVTEMMYALTRYAAIQAGCYPENPEFASFLEA
ncbi:MAG: 2-dehydropantoate 2-reductase [Rhodospirillaceae bacterium]|jgi:2-dehydropantoate 2-reductase|nr:2-dehydropantoate 2-reductase [Rhodospirillaceae bacterium]